MNNLGDLDNPLNFHGDSEINTAYQPNTPTLGVCSEVHHASDGDNDPGTAYARGIRDKKEAFGVNVSDKTRAYYAGARQMLHHKQMYKPCTCYDADGNIIKSKCKK